MKVRTSPVTNYPGKYDPGRLRTPKQYTMLYFSDPVYYNLEIPGSKLRGLIADHRLLLQTLKPVIQNVLAPMCYVQDCIMLSETKMQPKFPI